LIFFKVKQLAPKGIGTQTRLISGFSCPVLGVRNAVTFDKGTLQQNTGNFLCILNPAHRLVESARKLVQFWVCGNIFGVKTRYIVIFDPEIGTFLSAQKDCIFPGASFAPQKFVATSEGGIEM